METKYKSTISSNSSATTSSEINHSFKFTNLSFAENSESSVPAEAAASQLQRPEPAKQTIEMPVATNTSNKILPASMYQMSEASTAEKDESQKERTLVEIGFKATEIEGWENMNQPPKDNLYDLLKNMIENYIKPNVQVRIGDVSFNCHMMVLQCYSDFFMECSNEVIVQLPPEKITPQAFMMLYDWMLSPQPLVQREGILELFNAASFLQIKGLVDQCWVCLDDDIRFQEDTAFLLYLEARNHGLEMIQQLMLTRVCKFFLTLVASKDFLLLTVKEVCTLLSSNSIGVNSEMEILMAAVRWLNYNWNERQPELLNILSCVRFSLIPPWILVALGRDTDCACVDRVVNHPQVKKMINDGLSYTTTQLFYSDNVDNFVTFLERYQLTKPVQRQWICDQDCSYHHKISCPNRQFITHESFLEYLDMIRSKGKDHWKTVKMENQEGLNFQCCLPKASTPNDKFFLHLLPKESRDQGVQVSGEDEKGGGGTAACNTTPTRTVDGEASSYQEIHTPSIVCGGFGPPKSNNNVNYATPTKEDNKNITLSHKSSSCCDVNQKAINIKQSILGKSYHCSTGSQQLEVAVANSLTEAIVLTEKMLSLNPKPEEGQATGDDGRAGREAETKQTTLNRKPCLWGELNLGLTHHKVFIFGGNDPYAQRHQSDGPGKDVLYYDGCENVWKYAVNMPGSRHHHSAVVFRNKIYVIGGTRPPVSDSVMSVFETSVWSFDPKRLEWHNECHLPQSRRDFGLIAYDNDAAEDNKLVETGPGRCERKRKNRSGLYIIGGESIDGTPLSSTLFYDAERKQWFEKAPLNLGRYGLAAAVVNKKTNAEIWIAGGVCGQERGGVPVITDIVEFYSLSDDDAIWKKSLKTLRVPRLFARFCTVGGGKDLYIIGGISRNLQHPGEFSSISSVDFYNFQEERWVHLTDMIMSRHGHDVAVVNDRILIIGGVSADDKKTLKSVECFSTKTGRWVYNVAALPIPLSGLAAAVIDCDT